MLPLVLAALIAQTAENAPEAAVPDAAPESAPASTAPVEPTPAVPSVDPARESVTFQADQAPEPYSPLPIGAALVPGLLLHGSGAWAAGDRETAKHLLIAEGIGAGTLVTSIVGLAVTGASRQFTGVLLPTAVSGAFLFLGSWFADVYGVSVPLEHRGSAPAHTPRIELSLVTSYRYDPRAATDAILLPTAKVALGRWLLNGNAQIAPSNSTSRIRGDIRYRVFKRPADFVDLQFAVTNNRLGEDDINTLSLEFAVPARLDLGHLGRLLRGSFAELTLGGMITSVRYNNVDARETDGAVLGRGAIGAYLGDGDGEVQIFYDHRRDTLAGGAILGGISAGFVGYAGIQGTWFFSRHVGATALVEIGSALIAGGGLSMRFGEGN